MASVEGMAISAFDTLYSRNAKSFLKNAFGVNIGNNQKVHYNYREKGDEYDILFSPCSFRVQSGVYFENMPLNIEIQGRRCNNGIINGKSREEKFLSFILASGINGRSLESGKVYSFADFEEGFSPVKFNNFCDKIINKIGKNNASCLDALLRHDMDADLKKGMLYYLSDSFQSKSLKSAVFMPKLNQLALIYFDGKVKHAVFDCSQNQKRAKNNSLSSSTEDYIRNNYPKNIAKLLNSKDFEFFSLSDSVDFGSEIKKLIAFDKDYLKENIGKDYIK